MRHRISASSRTAVVMMVGAVVLGLVSVGVLATRAETPSDVVAADAASSADKSAEPATITATTAPTTIAAPSTTAAPTTSTTSPRRATMAFTGDVLLHSPVWRAAASNASGTDRPYDFTPMFDEIEPWIAGVDWAVCHMEVNLSADNTGLSSYPVFKGPGAIATDLAAVGYDACSTASNHSLDGRVRSTFETLDVLDAAGLDHTGTARSPEERLDTVWIEINGIRIAHLAYTYWFNGFQLPADAPWAANQIDEQQILGDAAHARDNGAEFVMLSLHWGEQYRHEPDALQADLGPRLLASDDIDLIIGHHAHVVQPIERIDGEWLVYGLGNLLHNQSQRPRRDELLVSLTVEEVEPSTFVVTELEVLPLFLDIRTYTIWPSGPALRGDDIDPNLDAALDASWERAKAVLETGSGWDELVLTGE